MCETKKGIRCTTKNKAKRINGKKVGDISLTKQKDAHPL